MDLSLVFLTKKQFINLQLTTSFSINIMDLNSYLFVSSHKGKVFERLKSWDKPDCYIFDLQDSCPDK